MTTVKPMMTKGTQCQTVCQSFPGKYGKISVRAYTRTDNRTLYLPTAEHAIRYNTAHWLSLCPPCPVLQEVWFKLLINLLYSYSAVIVSYKYFSVTLTSYNYSYFYLL